MNHPRDKVLKLSLAIQVLLILLAILGMFFPKLNLQNTTGCTYAEASPWGYAVWTIFIIDLLFRFSSAGSTLLGKAVAVLLVLFPAARLLGARYVSEAAFSTLYIKALGLLPLAFGILALMFATEIVFHFRVRKTNLQLTAALLFFILWECQEWICV